jgi:hypothetical protein
MVAYANADGRLDAVRLVLEFDQAETRIEEVPPRGAPRSGGTRPASAVQLGCMKRRGTDCTPVAQSAALGGGHSQWAARYFLSRRYPRMIANTVPPSSTTAPIADRRAAAVNEQRNSLGP